jgi:hypothetical protein
MAYDHPQPTKARVFLDSINEAECKSCHAAIVWAKLVKSGKNMPFDRLEVIKTGVDEDGNAYQTVSLKTVHWNSCPQAKQWKRNQAARDVSPSAPPAVDVPGAIQQLQQARELLRRQWREAQETQIAEVGQAVTRALQALGQR